ncbi:MAG TPA: BT_3928 family protein [Bacteroidia bacterium]|nr:BT_3928 family protein [Bacteroidia bacterium]
MKRIVKISQVLVGILFIFSGFVKADDPAGFTIKLHEYFAADALNMPWLDKFAFAMAFSIPIIEMTLGFMLLLGNRKKLTLVLVTLMMVFFTFLTWYTAHYNKVLECGCFGDAIPMTSWQSFYKNVVLMVFILVLIIGNKYMYSITGKAQNILVILFLAASTGFAYYCYNYLPVLDFRPYKVGTDIKQGMQGTPDEEKFFYTLKNKKSGETKEFDKFPDNYQNDWTFVSSRTEITKKGVEAKIKDFNISAMAGNDVTDSILGVKGNQFLLIMETISDANKDDETINKINALATECLKNHIGFICLTASDQTAISDYQKKYHTNFKFFNTDGTVLKTMIRANPGLILIKGGIVKAIWHYHSIPSYADVTAKYLQ